MTLATKQKIGGIACIGFGLLLVNTGFRDMKNATRLKETGISVPAQVARVWIESGRKGSQTYKVSATFAEKGSGSFHQRDFVVPRAVYQAAEQGGPISVRYLPADPNVAQIEGSGSQHLGIFIAGAVLILLGALILYAAIFKRTDTGPGHAPPS